MTDSGLNPMSEAAKLRLAQIAANTDETCTLRTSFGRTNEGDTVLELEWRSGSRDGEQFVAVLSGTEWDQYVQAVNEADESLR